MMPIDRAAPQTLRPSRNSPPHPRHDRDMDQIAPRLDPAKFRDPFTTAKGETRATVALRSLDTLWFNTGTLCNLTCANCYIESSPRNDRLAS